MAHKNEFDMALLYLTVTLSMVNLNLSIIVIY